MFLTDDELYVVVVAGTNMQKNYLFIFICFISGGGYWDWYNDLV